MEAMDESEHYTLLDEQSNCWLLGILFWDNDDEGIDDVDVASLEGNDDVDFASLEGFANDTGGISSQTNTAQEENNEFNMIAQPQNGTDAFQHCQSEENDWVNVIDWDAIPQQEPAAVEDGTDAFQHCPSEEIDRDAISQQEQAAVEDKDKYDSYIHVLDKTCIEETSKEGKSPEKGYSKEILSAHFGKPQNEAAKYFNVSRTKFKRICRSVGIERWPSPKKKLGSQSLSKLRRVNKEPSRTNSHCSVVPPLQETDPITVKANFGRRLNDDEPAERNFPLGILPAQDTPVDAHTSQVLNKVTVKAMYNGVTIRFELSDLSGLAELEDNVIERLHLERKSFSIKYQDDEDMWILIACDKDVQNCIELSRSLNKTTIMMLVDPPIN